MALLAILTDIGPIHRGKSGNEPTIVALSLGLPSAHPPRLTTALISLLLFSSLCVAGRGVRMLADDRGVWTMELTRMRGTLSVIYNSFLCFHIYVIFHLHFCLYICLSHVTNICLMSFCLFLLSFFIFWYFHWSFLKVILELWASVFFSIHLPAKISLHSFS
jgi:hypothetical protein